MPSWLARLFDIRSGELRRVGGMFALLGAIIATSYILKPVRSALFLSQFGSERLPYVYILVAVVLGVVAAVYAKWVPRQNLPRLFAGTAVFFAGSLLLFWLLTVSSWAYTGFLFYVWVSIFTAVMPSLFWLLANYVFYSNEGRRLFPIVMAGGLLGSILGGAITTVLVRWVGSSGLLPTASALLIGIAWLVRWNATEERERMNERRSDLARQERSRTLPDDTPLRLVTRSPYLSMIAMLLFLTTMTSTLVDYQFNSVVERSFHTMDALTGFFGTFFAAINVVAFVLQLLVVGRLLNRFGVVAGLSILPLALLASSVTFLAFPRLLTAALIKTSDDGLSNSVNRSSVEVLYLPISLAVKNRLKAWLDMFVERTSRGVAGLTILAATSYLSFSVQQISLVAICLLGRWIGLVLLLQREYVRTFRDSLSRRDISDFGSQLRDQASFAVFRQTLAGADSREIAYALELLQGVEDPTLLEQAAGLTSHEDPAIRTAALRLLRGASNPPSLDGFEARVRDQDPAAAAEALVLWIQSDARAGYRALQSVLADGDLRRVEAILDALSGTEKLVSKADLEAFVTRRSGSPDAGERRLAARASGFLSPDSELLDSLPDLLRDPEISVARAAAESIGRLRYQPAFLQLVESLERRPLRAAARTAIARLGVERLPELTGRLGNDREDAEIRGALPRVLAEFDDPRAVASLLEVLPQGDRRLHYQGIKALGKLRARFPDLRISRSEVERLLAYETSTVAALASLLHGARREPAELESHQLLIKALEERISFTRERIFRLLGLVYPPDEIFSAWIRIVYGRPAVRATALEYLSNVLSKKHRVEILPLVEAQKPDEIHERARALLGTGSLGFAEALKRLLRHRDDWLAATAATLVGGLDRTPFRSELESIRDHPSLVVREAVASALGN